MNIKEINSEDLKNHRAALLPSEIKNIMMKIQESLKTKPYVVGGYVRSTLLRYPSKDIDLVSAATPSELLTVFPEAHRVSARNKVPMVIADGVEISTMRREAGTRKNMHSILASSIEEDCRRRDFTINAMYMDIHGTLYDPTQMGLHDAAKRILRFVGDADMRLYEDPTRAMRALKFSAKYNLTLEDDAWKALSKLASSGTRPSNDMLTKGLLELLKLEGMQTARALNFMTGTLLEEWFPELACMVGVAQNRWHAEGDVWRHTQLVCSVLDSSDSDCVHWAALLHDVGKPSTQKRRDGEDGYSFYDHEKSSVEIAKAFMDRLQFPTLLKEAVLFLVGEHMRIGYFFDMKLSKRIQLMKSSLFPELVRLNYADNLGRWDLRTGKPDEKAAAEFSTKLAKAYTEFLDIQNKVKRSMPNGKDLILAGYSPGKELGGKLALIESDLFQRFYRNQKLELTKEKIIAKIKQARKQQDG